MAIRQDLLFKENIITEEELAKICNPISEELLLKYKDDISLSGFSKVVEEYVSKINSYMTYGNMDKLDTHYEEETVKEKVVRYHKLTDKEICGKDDLGAKETEIEIAQYDKDGNYVGMKKQNMYTKTVEPYYIDCLADDEGAEPYDYYIETKQYLVKKGASADELMNLEIDGLPDEFASLNTIDISMLRNNLENLRTLFFKLNVMTKKVGMSFFDDIIDAIKKCREDNLNAFKEKQYFNKEQRVALLPVIKQQYISLYNIYEDLMARQSLFIKKAKHTDGGELDIGLKR